MHLLLALLLSFAWATPAAQDHYTALEHTLQRVVGPTGNVRWKVLQTDHAELDSFVTWLAGAGPGSTPALFPNRTARLAYLINAYNALVLSGVLPHYPTDSVMKIAGGAFFRTGSFVLDGKKTSLDQIEEAMRKSFRDPRIHYAINCGSKSCPPHWRETADPDRLDAQLAEAEARILQNTRFVRLDGSAGIIELNKIFDWYSGDFAASAKSPAGNPATVVDYLKAHMPELYRPLLEGRKVWKVTYLEYDWGLNEAKTQ